MAQPTLHTVDTQTMLTFIQEKRAINNTPGLTWHEHKFMFDGQVNPQTNIYQIILDSKGAPCTDMYEPNEEKHNYYECNNEAEFFQRMANGQARNQFKLGGAPDDDLRTVLYSPSQIVRIVADKRLLTVYTFPNPGITEYLFGQLQEKLQPNPAVTSWNIIPHTAVTPGQLFPPAGPAAPSFP